MLQNIMKWLTVFISAQQNVFSLHRIYNYCSHKQVDFFFPLSKVILGNLRLLFTREIKNKFSFPPPPLCSICYHTAAVIFVYVSEKALSNKKPILIQLLTIMTEQFNKAKGVWERKDLLTNWFPEAY